MEILRVSNLGVNQNGRILLDGVNFSLEAGKTLAIVGPNGAGKTTLFRALMNLIPFSGSVEWAGDTRIGYVPQSLVSTDLPISVEEFIRLKGVVESRKCLEMVGLDQSISKQRISRLSGGQLQRVLLAWAISDRPEVLLFDEPTSLVDIGTEEPIYDMIREMKETWGVTVLLISHNMHVVSHYTDLTLALNRKQNFYGPTGEISHTRLISLMSGIGER